MPLKNSLSFVDWGTEKKSFNCKPYVGIGGGSHSITIVLY